MNPHLHRLKYLVIVGAVLLVYYLTTTSEVVQKYLADPSSLKYFIQGFGILAPIGIIILQAFQTTLSLIPSQITTIVAGFIFGPWLGLLYSLMGSFIGSALIFLISRKYGKNLALKIFNKKEIVHFHLLFRQRKNWGLFLARITPIFPNDLVSFGAGLTTISFRNFNIISTTGFIVQMTILTMFGSELSSGIVSFPLIAISTLVSFLLLILIFKNKIKELLIEGISEVKRGEKFLEMEFKKI